MLEESPINSALFLNGLVHYSGQESFKLMMDLIERSNGPLKAWEGGVKYNGLFRLLTEKN